MLLKAYCSYSKYILFSKCLRKATVVATNRMHLLINFFYRLTADSSEAFLIINVWPILVFFHQSHKKTKFDKCSAVLFLADMK